MSTPITAMADLFERTFANINEFLTERENTKMTKATLISTSDMISDLLPILGGDKKKLKADLEVIFNYIEKQVLEHGTDVRIQGFGTFKLKERAERQGRNPATGEAITIPASSSVVFKASKLSK